jgi:hypothetical protein
MSKRIKTILLPIPKKSKLRVTSLNLSKLINRIAYDVDELNKPLGAEEFIKE